jgi:hypothetical protein
MTTAAHLHDAENALKGDFKRVNCVVVIRGLDIDEAVFFRRMAYLPPKDTGWTLIMTNVTATHPESATGCSSPSILLSVGPVQL